MNFEIMSSVGVCQDEPWFDSSSILDSDSDDNDFSSVHGGKIFTSFSTASNFFHISFTQIVTLCFEMADSVPSIGNGPNAQLLQYESTSCFIDTGSMYEGFYESYLKIDGGAQNFEYTSQEFNMNTCLPCLPPSVNYNEKNHSSSPQPANIKKSAVIMLSVKRKSVDGYERTEYCA